MLLFVILGQVPVLLLICLLGLVYLAWFDMRGERLEPLVQLWWFLLVLLFNVVGYAVLRVWLIVRRRRAAARRPA